MGTQSRIVGRSQRPTPGLDRTKGDADMTETMTRTPASHAAVPARGKGLLTFTLWFGMLDVFLFGATTFFFPEFVIDTLAESAEVSFFAMRWGGGLLMALAVGYAYMLRRPAGQMPMFTTFALASTMAGIGFFWSWLADEYTGNDWYLIALFAGTFGLALFMWITRFVSKELLD